MAKADIAAGISDTSNLCDCGSWLTDIFGGVPDIARRAALRISRDNQSVSPESRDLTLAVGVSQACIGLISLVMTKTGA